MIRNNDKMISHHGTTNRVADLSDVIDFLSLRKHAYSNTCILEISPPKTVSFLYKNSDIIHITALKHRL